MTDLENVKTHPYEKANRNRLIFIDHREGLSWYELSKKWNLGMMTLKRIVKRWEGYSRQDN